MMYQIDEFGCKARNCRGGMLADFVDSKTGLFPVVITGDDRWMLEFFYLQRCDLPLVILDSFMQTIFFFCCKSCGSICRKEVACAWGS